MKFSSPLQFPWISLLCYNFFVWDYQKKLIFAHNLPLSLLNFYNFKAFLQSFIKLKSNPVVQKFQI